MTARGLLAAAMLVLGTAAAWAEDPIDVAKLRYKKGRALERVTARFEAQIPSEARLPDGRPNTSHPEYQRVKSAWEEQVGQTRAHYDAQDNRAEHWEQARHEAIAELDQKAVQRGTMTPEQAAVPIAQRDPLSLPIQGSGSPPKALESDGDYTAMSHEAAEAFEKALKRDRPGVRVGQDSLRTKIAGDDLTTWKTPAAREAAGSSSHEAMWRHKALSGQDTFPTAGGMHATTGGRLGVEDPRGAVLSNMRKGLDHGLNGPPEEMHLQSAAKSTHKAMQAAGLDKQDPAFTKQLETLRNHKLPEEAGVVTFGASAQQKTEERAAFQGKIQEKMGEAYEASGKRSEALDARRTRQAQEALAAGDKTEHTRLRTEQIESRVSNEVAMQEMARDDPSFVKKMTGLDPDAVPGREKLIDRSAKVTRLAEETVGSAKAAPLSPADPVAPHSTPTELANKWGDRVMTGLDVLSGGISGAETEMEEAIRQGRSPSKVRAARNALGNTLWGMTGIPMVQEAVGGAHDIAVEELNEADARFGADGHLGIAARIRALTRTGSKVAGWDAASDMAQEEIAHEEAQARQEGREPSYARSSVNGVARAIGSSIGLSKIAEFASTDWGQKAEAAQEERFQRYWAQARAKESLEQIKAIEDELRAAAMDLDPLNAAHRERLEALADRYAQARDTMLKAGQFLRKQVGGADADTMAIYDTIAKLPKPEEFRKQTLDAYDPAALDQEIARESALPQDAEAAAGPREPGQTGEDAMHEQTGDEWTTVGGPTTVDASAEPDLIAEPAQEMWETPPPPPVAEDLGQQAPSGGMNPQAVQTLIGGLVGLANTAINQQQSTPAPIQPPASSWGQAPQSAGDRCATNFYLDAMRGMICQCADYHWDTRANACVPGPAPGAGGVASGFGSGSPTNAPGWENQGYQGGSEPQPAPMPAVPAPAPPQPVRQDPCAWVRRHAREAQERGSWGVCTYTEEDRMRVFRECGVCPCPTAGPCQ